jgi:4a-hydroxytetrahydrobiopterin dehydratase
MPTLLDDTALNESLSTLSEWSGDRSSINRTIHVSGAELEALLENLEIIAREMNHDPDTTISGGDLTITMSTHSAGGVTELDIEYARRVDALLV